MGSFEVHWRPSIRKDLRALPPHEVARIVKAVEELAAEPLPHGVQKLTNSERTYRMRVGDYRVIYEAFLPEKRIEIQRVRHRKDVYRH